MQFDNTTPAALHYSLSEIQEIAKRNGSSETTPAQGLLNYAHSYAYYYICVPLTNEKWNARWRRMCIKGDEIQSVELEREAEAWRLGPGFRQEEVTVTRLDETGSVIAIASEWLELDSPDSRIRRDAEIALLQEISYASYLSIYTVIFPTPRNRTHVASYARAVNAVLLSTSDIQISVRIALSTGHELAWEMWDCIRTICNYHPRLSLTLDLSPSYPMNSKALARWIAEPTRYVFVPAGTFTTNPKGFPVFHKVLQNFMKDIVTQRPTIIISQIQFNTHRAGGPEAYLKYMRWLESESPVLNAMKTEGSVENFARGYHDYLQAPLQPLMDNLQSMTYEIFEKDPVKYTQYEKAVYLALCDRPLYSEVVICVVGAGRGPLVAGCLQAIEKSGRSARVYAVEKNPNAYVTLQERKVEEWGDSVELFFGDMRTIELPEKADILVSELLGSFGDNELSPECLDGAERLLAKNGISIPASYSAYLAPLTSSKLHNEVSVGDTTGKTAETPYVVMFHAVNLLSQDGGGPYNRCGGKVQKAWEFTHPRCGAVLDCQGLPFTNTHNTRSTHLSFYIPLAGSLHGFAGYFESVLYGDVCLSIHPDTKDTVSPDMLSWFPLFFPLKEPLYLPGESELHISMWRLTDRRKVWYEWSAEAFVPVPRSFIIPGSNRNETSSSSKEMDDSAPVLVKIGQTTLHNQGGKHSWIGL